MNNNSNITSNYPEITQNRLNNFVNFFSIEPKPYNTYSEFIQTHTYQKINNFDYCVINKF